MLAYNNTYFLNYLKLISKKLFSLIQNMHREYILVMLSLLYLYCFLFDRQCSLHVQLKHEMREIMSDFYKDSTFYT